MQMNTTQTLEQMKQLRLQGMYHAYRSQLELPLDQQLDGHDLVAQLVQSEELYRNNEKTAYYLKLYIPEHVDPPFRFMLTHHSGDVDPPQ
jgi:hypothetical protein